MYIYNTQGKGVHGNSLFTYCKYFVVDRVFSVKLVKFVT